MPRKLFGLMALVAVVLALAPMAESQPPADNKGRGGPPFKLGQVFPPPLRAELNLTPEQEKELEAITKDLKVRLDKLLTPEQKRTVENFRPRGQGAGGQGDRGGKVEEKSGKDGPGGKDNEEVSRKASIQWFATLSRGLAEARRTGKPILFVSAAPHCAGVSGMW